MTSNPITVPTAANLMVSQGVCRLMADRADTAFTINVKPQSALKTKMELPICQMETKGRGRNGSQPVSSMWKGGREHKGSRLEVRS